MEGMHCCAAATGGKKKKKSKKEGEKRKTRRQGEGQIKCEAEKTSSGTLKVGRGNPLKKNSHAKIHGCSEKTSKQGYSRKKGLKGKQGGGRTKQRKRIYDYIKRGGGLNN